MESRIVPPDTTRLSISNGDWILVKTRLSAGERNDSFDRMYVRKTDGSYLTTPDGRLVSAPRLIALATVTAYLVDWSLVGVDGVVIPIRGAGIDAMTTALHSLDPESFDEILATITAHETARAAERAAQKKILLGTRGDEVISRLPSVADGVLTGSAI